MCTMTTRLVYLINENNTVFHGGFERDLTGLILMWFSFSMAKLRAVPFQNLSSLSIIALFKS